MADGGRQIFAYEAQTVDGAALRGTLEADSAVDAQARLGKLQLRILALGPAEPTQAGRPGVALSADDFLIFNQQLAYLTAAGLPVERGLRLIAADFRAGKLSKAANEVAQDLEKGMPLKEAFSKHASRFPPLYGKLVDAGAVAGNLSGMLFNLGRHMELVARLRRVMWRTLSYPVMVLATLSVVLLFISVIVVPHFTDIYSGFRVNLPVLTVWLMDASRVYPWVFVVGWGIVVVLVVVDSVLRLLTGWGIPWGRVMVRLPLIGPVLRANLLARWIDGLRLGIEAGLDLPRAIGLATDAAGSRALARDAAKLSDVITRGQPLSAYRGRVIPPTVPAAMELAGHAGDLPASLMSLTRMYEQQAEYRLRMLPSILTPLMVVLIASGIGTCIGALFLPLIRLIQSVSGGD